MKLTKVDVAQALGLKFICTSPTNFEAGCYSTQYAFELGQKIVYAYGNENCLDKAWEDAADELLEPLLEFLLGNLGD